MESYLSCDEMKLLISAYFDNELSDEESLYVENHLKQCEKCSLELENIKKLSQTLKGYDARTNISQTETLSFILNRLNNEQTVSCDEVLDELAAYYDGELDLKLHYSIEDHLNTCTGCKAEFEKIKKLGDLIRSSANTDVELDIWPKVEADLEKVYICDKVQDKISPYLDKELTKDEIILVSQHLLECKHCRRDYDDLKYTQSLVHRYFKNISKYNELALSRYKNVLKRLELQERRRVFFASVAISLIIASLTWVSITTVEPDVIKSTYVYQSDLKIPAEPLYVKSENLVFAQNYSTQPEGVLAVLYGND